MEEDIIETPVEKKQPVTRRKSINEIYLILDFDPEKSGAESLTNYKVVKDKDALIEEMCVPGFGTTKKHIKITKDDLMV